MVFESQHPLVKHKLTLMRDKNTKPKKLRKKAISNGCSWLDASRMHTAMQPKMTVLATIRPTARLTSAARDAGVLAFKRGRRRSARR